MISAAERCELGRAFIAPDGIQAGMAERVTLYVPGLRNDRAPISTAGRHSPAKIGQHLAGDPWIIQGRRPKIQAHSQHATSDVASNCLWIDQVRRGDDNTYANVGRQMHVRHYGNLLHIGGATEALNRSRHFMPHWCREPNPDGSH